MLPYQAVAMDYTGYQRQGVGVGGSGGGGVGGIPGSHMGHMGALGMSVGGPPFTHSWLVPSQELCAVPYKQMPNQHQNTTMHSQQSLEPGLWCGAGGEGILELRKEKSRDAARSRRGKENYEFYELAKMLPLPPAITSQLDKASIIRLTISYLKLRDFSGHGDPPWSRDNNSSSKVLKTAARRTPAGVALDLFEQHQGTHILQSLDGFALAIAADGRFLYISETVSIYLGLSQVEMTGSSIFDYIHLQDHSEVAEQLGLSLSNGQGLASPSSGGSDEGTGNHGTNNPDVSASMTLNSQSMYKDFERAFCVRMKSTLTKRGCHFKSSGYRASEDSEKPLMNGGKVGKSTANHYSVVLMLCRLRPQYTFSHSRKSQPPILGMVALAIALPPPSVHEIRLENDMFVTRINFNFTIAHCEPKVTELLDYTPDELTGRNLYNLCHGEDSDKLRKSHLDLINKGQVLTHYYRIMNKLGGYTWLQTCATVVCNSKNADEQNIICVNYVVSNRENENLILDCIQLENGLDIIKNEEIIGDNSTGSPGSDPSNNDGSSGPSSTSQHQHHHQHNQQQQQQHHHHQHQQQQSSNDEQKSPKSETSPESRTTKIRSHTTQLSSSTNAITIIDNSNNSNSNNSTNNSTTDIQNNSIVINEENLVPIVVPPQQQQQQQQQTTSRKGHKRKLKHIDNNNCNTIDNNNITIECPTKIASTMLTNQELQQSPASTPHHQQQQQQQQRNTTEDHTESSVKDLENAMSKHLPSPISSNNHHHLNGGSNSNASTSATTTTDFSTDALLKQQQQQQQQLHQQNQHHHHQQQNDEQHEKSSSTIQWIGGNQHIPFHQQSATMPATALLRQIYANRESVIRATARQTSNGVYYSDGPQSGPLPTPPGNDGTFDQQFLIHSGQKTNDAFTNLVSTYGGYPTTLDYHNAMTPPSSVSPRDSINNNNNNNNNNNSSNNSNSNNSSNNNNNIINDNNNNNKSTTIMQQSSPHGYEYVDVLRSQYTNGAGTTDSAASNSNSNGGGGGIGPSLPLKPQPYSAAVAMHHANSIEAYGNLDQTQYFPHHSSFHLYHKSTPSGGWYSMPS